MPTKQVSVGTTQVTLVEANEKRTALLIINAHATQTLYVSDDSSVSTANGFPVLAQTTILLSKNKDQVEIDKRIVAIASGAGTTIGVWEHFQTPQPEPEPGPNVQEPEQADPFM